MRKLTIILTMLGLLFVIISGCNGGDGAAPLGTAPKINDAALYDIYWDETYSFAIGDWVNWAIWATDPDLDMTSLYVTQYHPSDSTTPYYGPDYIGLPSQSDADMIYYAVNPTQVIGPIGSWRIEFQVEDAKGNDSNIFKIYVSVY